MRKTFLCALALSLVFAACKKSSDNKCPYTPTTQTAPAAEVTNLKAVLDAASITYTQHSSGIFYSVNSPGSGATPNVCSYLTVKYAGRLTNGAGFDSSYVRDPAGTSFTLGELIPGWQIGIPLIQNGGSITLYIPPSLGYGARDSRDQNGNIVIPANSNLVFNIQLVNVQ